MDFGEEPSGLVAVTGEYQDAVAHTLWGMWHAGHEPDFMRPDFSEPLDHDQQQEAQKRGMQVLRRLVRAGYRLTKEKYAMLAGEPTAERGRGGAEGSRFFIGAFRALVDAGIDLD